MPAVAVGIDDIIGTGVYNGEYVVASKRFGDIDTSIGMGWGRRAGTAELRNPLALVIKSFDKRQSFSARPAAPNSRPSSTATMSACSAARCGTPRSKACR